MLGLFGFITSKDRISLTGGVAENRHNFNKKGSILFGLSVGLQALVMIRRVFWHSGWTKQVEDVVAIFVTLQRILQAMVGGQILLSLIYVYRVVLGGICINTKYA